MRPTSHLEVKEKAVIYDPRVANQDWNRVKPACKTTTKLEREVKLKKLVFRELIVLVLNALHLFKPKVRYVGLVLGLRVRRILDGERAQVRLRTHEIYSISSDLYVV